MRQTKTGKRGNRGQAVVEFAIVLPILLVLGLYIVQYGVIYRTTILLTNLTREGARYAAIAPVSDDPIIQRVEDATPPFINYSDIEGKILVHPDEGDSDRIPGSGGEITVEISYDMNNKIFMPNNIFGVHLFAETYTTQATFAVQ